MQNLQQKIAYLIQQHIKEVYIMTKWNLSPEYKASLVSKN
jgi:hypothetical protein